MQVVWLKMSVRQTDNANCQLLNMMEQSSVEYHLRTR